MGLFCAALLVALPGCARRTRPTEVLTLRSEPVRVWRSEALRSYSIKRLAIIPFTHEPKVGTRGRELARMLFRALAQARNYALVSPLQVDRLLQEMVGEFATGADRKQGVAIARQLAADAALVGHLVRYQELSARVREILAGGGFVEMSEADWCCGGAGSYNVSHAQLSGGILDRKMANVRKSGAGTVLTSCPACMLQLRLGKRRAGLPVRVAHLTEFLDEHLNAR